MPEGLGGFDDDTPGGGVVVHRGTRRLAGAWQCAGQWDQSKAARGGEVYRAGQYGRHSLLEGIPVEHACADGTCTQLLGNQCVKAWITWSQLKLNCLRLQMAGLPSQPSMTRHAQCTGDCCLRQPVWQTFNGLP